MRAAIARAREILAQPIAALVSDIDGTLAADSARHHLRPKAVTHCLADVEATAVQAYMAEQLVARDRPIDGARQFVGVLRAPRVFVVTGRWEPLRRVTESWLREHYPTFRHEKLLMRRTADVARPSVSVKLDLVLQHCRTGVWLDDDPEMLAVAERHGFVGLRAPEVFDYWREVNLWAGVIP